MPTKPIHLYVATHKITGLKYFGKTVNPNPWYKGGGVRWNNHLKKHGKQHVEMNYIAKFENVDEAKKFALQFSEENNIVESDEWANLRPENAVDGMPTGFNPYTHEQRKAMWSAERRAARAGEN